MFNLFFIDGAIHNEVFKVNHLGVLWGDKSYKKILWTGTLRGTRSLFLFIDFNYILT